MLSPCKTCGILYETTVEDAYDPREEMHRCSKCWKAEKGTK